MTRSAESNTFIGPATDIARLPDLSRKVDQAALTEFVRQNMIALLYWLSFYPENERPIIDVVMRDGLPPLTFAHLGTIEHNERGVRFTLTGERGRTVGPFDLEEVRSVRVMTGAETPSTIKNVAGERKLEEGDLIVRPPRSVKYLEGILKGYRGIPSFNILPGGGVDAHSQKGEDAPLSTFIYSGARERRERQGASR